ncbi:hypothetical protein [Natronobiforma cellulositropha]|uniref:hypothetical protein n=1 Tax=Natronobiforma cellulositropha TaxID=1679076 RepID=UPI0021D5F57E|nr:hypothetical protein [Natronobiforma cellulositropha]
MRSGAPGEGDRDSGPSSDEFDVLAALTGLDADDAETRAEALTAVRAAVDDVPERCAPTVPKLRSLLEDPSFDGSADVLYCLAELAVAVPTDVAPSTDSIVAFTAAHHPSAGSADGFRCLANVARERPDAVAGHVDELVTSLETELDEWGLTLLARLSAEEPAAVAPAASVLVDALEETPDRYASDACVALANLSRADDTALEDAAALARTVDTSRCVDALDESDGAVLRPDALEGVPSVVEESR